MRCKYCHNPDTWKPETGTVYTPDDIIALFLKNKSFYKNGGITVTGGEPLLQLEFVTGLFSLAKENGIHTTLDTSGILFNNNNIEAYNKLLSVTDLVLLDVKHIDDEKHKFITGCSNSSVIAFAKHLSDISKDVWIRHVVVPNLTDTPEDLIALGEFLSTLKNIKALEVLPYHTMGVSKYNELKVEYPLEGTLPLTNDELKKAKHYILQGAKKE